MSFIQLSVVEPRQLKCGSQIIWLNKKDILHVCEVVIKKHSYTLIQLHELLNIRSGRTRYYTKEPLDALGTRLITDQNRRIL